MELTGFLGSLADFATSIDLGRKHGLGPQRLLGEAEKGLYRCRLRARS